jgi:hypothetical protein
MQKPYLFLAVVLYCLLTVNCNKSNKLAGGSEKPALIAEAKAFFTAMINTASPVIISGNPGNMRTQTARSVLWEEAHLSPFGKSTAVVVPLHFAKPLFVKSNLSGGSRISLDNLTKLLLYRDSAGAWHAEMITAIPDTAWINHCHKPFSGISLIEDWWGNPEKRFLFAGDGSIKRYKPNQGNSIVSPTSPGIAGNVSDMMIVTCYSIDGYNYSSDDPEGGYAWSEDLGCSYSYLEDGGGGGDYGGPSGDNGGGGIAGGVSVSNSISVTPPAVVIPNVIDYLKCFTSDPSASYGVTVCVDQPRPNTRTPWTWALNTGSSSPGGNYIDPGHVFLVLSETSGGTTITRNIGFYPSVNVTPFSSSAPAAMGNDENHIYNISGSFSTNNAMFFNILGYFQAAGAAGYNYDVNNNNCTTFVLNALSTGHIYLPSTIGYWIGGLGNDPGDLGEDIRGTDFVGMTRSTTYSGHPNAGSCN